jgi:acyl-coenzyme A synthetase/AMP-(fatty) acid ligase
LTPSTPVFALHITADIGWVTGHTYIVYGPDGDSHGTANDKHRSG